MIPAISILRSCSRHNAGTLRRAPSSVQVDSMLAGRQFTTMPTILNLNQSLTLSSHQNEFYNQKGDVLRSFSTDKKNMKQRGFVPRKAAVKLTGKARRFCKLLLKNSPGDDVIGIMLKYQMSTAGQMKMVFAFEFARRGDIGPDDEGVSLELLDDGSPKPPDESSNDDLPKLYVHNTAFMKVLGGEVDVDIKKDGSFTPIMFDREGHLLDPNA